MSKDSRTLTIQELLKKCGAVKIGKFILASGKESNYYIDIKRASTSPEILKEIGKELAKRIESSTNKIACVELGAVPLAVAASLEAKIPFVIIRKQPKGHGTNKLIEGDVTRGERVTIIEDVTTTGTSVAKAVDILRDAGASVEEVLVVVDREEGALELLANKKVKLLPIVKASEITNKL
jgi:orotate phosphoribosyltransferase